MKGSFNDRVLLAMRGISTNANEAAIGLTSGVSIMIDGVPVPSDSMAANELQGILRVEVLKGPQSTLGGPTASAGIINCVTNSPSKVWTGEVGATATSDKEVRLSARVSGPLSNALGLSLSAYRNERDYPIKNLTPGAALFPYFPFAPSGVAQSTAFPGINIGYGNTAYASPVRMLNKVRDNDVSPTVEKRLGDYTFTSVTAQQREKINLVQDVTAQNVYFLTELRNGAIPDPPLGPPLFDNPQSLKIDPISTRQEFRIASPIDQAVSFVAGLFHSDVEVSQDTFRMMFVNPKIDIVTSKIQTTGLYGCATWKLCKDTSLLTGLRWKRDKLDYTIDDKAGGHSSANTDSASAVGDLTLRQKLGKDHRVYGAFARGYKPRAFNTAATLTSNAALQAVEKEDIDHLEIGVKRTLLGGALVLNLAAFNTTCSNFQVQL